MSKKLKKIDQEIDSINQVNLINKIVEELLSKADPKKLFGRDGLFQQLKKQIVERVLASELEYDFGYSKHSKVPRCIVPDNAGTKLDNNVILYRNLATKEIIWDKYYMLAPERRRQYVSALRIVKRA